MSFASGDTPPASTFNDFVAPGWVAYTPVWSSTGTAPSLGNGTITGHWRRSTDSDLVITCGRLIMGSTSTYGTGNFLISLAVAASVTSQNEMQGSVYILDSGTQSRVGVCDLQSTSTLQFETSSGGITATSPQTWAATDVLRWWLAYEPA